MVRVAVPFVKVGVRVREVPALTLEALATKFVIEGAATTETV